MDALSLNSRNYPDLIFKAMSDQICIECGMPFVGHDDQMFCSGCSFKVDNDLKILELASNDIEGYIHIA
jgi:hypothetical protein